ncbi:MAG: hypothetical protein QM398_04585 [Thermoproteota archaeon]|nr:hypothetical protein [Thermoproteota archaeon]NLD65527.1 hypothetical protein [Thermoproteota archaeon]
MHKAILSERERKLLTKYLNDETITDVTFRMLKLRIKRNYNCIKQDYKLLEQVMAKLQQKHT